MQTSTTAPMPMNGHNVRDGKAPRIFARTLFKDMRNHSLSNEQILAVASELIALVTQGLKDDEDQKGNA